MIELIVFLIAGAACLAGALGVVFARNPVHAALMLVMTLFGIAVLFVVQEAHFLAAVQVIVYAGAIVVLIMFVIMLLGVDRTQALELRSLPAQIPAAIIFGVAGLAVLISAIVAVDDPATGLVGFGGQVDGTVPDIDQLARSLFGDYLYAFELTSLLLVIAVVGAVVLARRPTRAERARMMELAAEDLAEAATRAPAGEPADETAEDSTEEPSEGTAAERPEGMAAERPEGTAAERPEGTAAERPEGMAEVAAGEADQDQDGG
jgi:NADH-quinone oxidoreductase subunit J